MTRTVEILIKSIEQFLACDYRGSYPIETCSRQSR
jgi:hypothetical protein